MPIITDIKNQKRDQTRLSVDVDGRYAFALSDLEMSNSGLRIGQSLGAEEVDAYQKQSGEAKAYAQAVRFLGVRPRSGREIRDYLWRKGYESEVAAVALERLERTGLANDQAFAASWIASRQALRPRSRRMLAQELAAKGVSRDDIDVALAELDGESELETLTALAQKKRRLPQYAEPEKLKSYLARQGYTYDLVRQALERLEQG